MSGKKCSGFKMSAKSYPKAALPTSKVAQGIKKGSSQKGITKKK